ncbi:unnamed protein product [Pedinophyceae sp. YPF-701]|nr:unnamed protein product [Pedinophyceae sp. YPF-701]
MSKTLVAPLQLVQADEMLAEAAASFLPEVPLPSSELSVLLAVGIAAVSGAIVRQHTLRIFVVGATLVLTAVVGQVTGPRAASAWLATMGVGAVMIAYSALHAQRARLAGPSRSERSQAKIEGGTGHSGDSLSPRERPSLAAQAPQWDARILGVLRGAAVSLADGRAVRPEEALRLHDSLEVKYQALTDSSHRRSAPGSLGRPSTDLDGPPQPSATAYIDVANLSSFQRDAKDFDARQHRGDLRGAHGAQRHRAGGEQDAPGRVIRPRRGTVGPAPSRFAPILGRLTGSSRASSDLGLRPDAKSQVLWGGKLDAAGVSAGGKPKHCFALLLNGGVDLAMLPWYLWVLLTDPAPGSRIVVLTMTLDGLASIAAFYVTLWCGCAATRTSRLLRNAALLCATAATCATVTVMRQYRWPVPSSVLFPQTAYLCLLTMYNAHVVDDALYATLSIVMTTAVALANQTVDLVYDAATVPPSSPLAALRMVLDGAAAVPPRELVLAAAPLVAPGVAALLLMSAAPLWHSAGIAAMIFVAQILKEVVGMAVLGQAPVASGINVCLSVVVFACGYKMHCLQQEHESVILEIYPPEVARAIADANAQHLATIRQVMSGDEAAVASLHGALPFTRYHDNVTIMFLDVVGFTPMSERNGPDPILRMLHKLFCTLDAAVLSQGARTSALEGAASGGRWKDRRREAVFREAQVLKMDTIGDAYIVAAGLHAEPQHADAVVRFAVRAAGLAQGVMQPDGGPLEVRVGVHSGAAVAGVAGLVGKRLSLFGDTVNTASRMETTAKANHVQISATTFQMLTDVSLQSLFKPNRNHVHVKGKGVMVTYLTRAPPMQPSQTSITSGSKGERRRVSLVPADTPPP